MVPRSRVTMLDAATPWEDVVRIVAASPFSRIPVYRGSPDNVIGILPVKDLATHYSVAGRASIERLLKPACRIPADLPADRVLSLLRDRRSHQALVTDEENHIIGLIAIQDVLATFLEVERRPGELR
jgi:CBS domain containing-hemolysin-like protein